MNTTSSLPLSSVEVGAELPALSVQVTRETLVRYAGASGDFNPIHYSDHAARSLGLAGCLAHGMLTMALALRVVTDWAGPDRIASCGTKFTKPVMVNDDGVGATVTVVGRVTKVEDALATVALEVTCGDDKVLGAATAEVRLG